MSIQKLFTQLKGSSTSGNYGHAGIPGKRGGSAPGGGRPGYTPLKSVREHTNAAYMRDTYAKDVKQIGENEYLTGKVNDTGLAYKIKINKGSEPNSVERNRGIKDPLVSIDFEGVMLK